MFIEHRRIGSKGYFLVSENDTVLAELVYTQPAEDRMIIEHTQVSDEMRGKNIGYELVDHTVEYARQHHMKIIPLCTFAHSVFTHKADYADVWLT